MSPDLEHNHTCSLQSQFSWPFVAFLAIASGISIEGCGNSEPKEISAATSGYLPPNEKDAKPSPSISKSPVENSAPTSNPGSSSGLPIAPEVPAFEPGKLDPKIASQLYMTLKLGDLNGAKPLMDFLDKSTRAFRELLADARNTKKQVPRDIVLDRGMILSRMKLEASQRLEKLAVNEEEKAASSLGIIEAYSQMAGFGDVAALDSLRETVSKEIANADPRVAQQAMSISLGLLAGDYDSGSAKASELVALANRILSDGNPVTLPILTQLFQSVEVLAKHNEEVSALEIAKKAEESARENDEIQLAFYAWQLHASRLAETKTLVSMLQPDSKASQDPARVREAIDALMTKIPSPWTSLFLVNESRDVEYSGRPTIAKEMIEAAQPQIKNFKSAENSADLEKRSKMFWARYEILNKPLDLSDLVDVAGKPIDLNRYQGKVVLVDFWATWCRPCLAEIPNIEQTFAAHNKDGFEVIGINLDEDRAKLDSFLSSQKLPWSTYVSGKPDGIGFDTPLAKKIGIAAIPFIAILGKDGNVAAVHIRGEKLESTIVELLAKE